MRPAAYPSLRAAIFDLNGDAIVASIAEPARIMIAPRSHEHRSAELCRDARP